jgi:hypothetical protein
MDYLLEKLNNAALYLLQILMTNIFVILSVFILKQAGGLVWAKKLENRE